MSIFSKIFGQKREIHSSPPVEFGRFSDGYKPDEKYDAWDLAIDAFEKNEYKSSLLAFLEYLKSPMVENVMHEEVNGQIHFKLLQGSKEIKGFMDQYTIRAEGKIANAHKVNIGFLRRLLEGNFNLKYGRYCLDEEQNITIIFDSIVHDASPYKLYYGLKEIALAADKQDDLLLDEFAADLLPVNYEHTRSISDREKEVKYAYLNKSINNVLNYLQHGRLNPSQYPGGITYLLLNTIYRLDFLIRPEGYLMEAFERMHRSYFTANDMSTKQKNHVLAKELREILERPKDKVISEMYYTTSTFGMITPTNHQKLVDAINSELENLTWYKENKYDEVALAIPGYIVGLSLFNYSLPEPDKELLQLYYEITEPEFFGELGFVSRFQHNHIFNKKAIRYEISEVESRWRSIYPKLKMDLNILNFADKISFTESYLRMLAVCNMSRTS